LDEKDDDHVEGEEIRILKVLSTSSINIGIAVDQVDAGNELNQGDLGIIIYTWLLFFDLWE
jgi:hypothetical protein